MKENVTIPTSGDNLPLTEGGCNLQPATCQRQPLTAVVTGASSGIGREYARQLCERGYDVVMVSNEDVPLRQAAEEFAEAHGVRTYPVCMDLAVPEAAKRLHEYCHERGWW